MLSLPDGEKISKIRLFVLTSSTNVTDGQTDRQTDGQTLHDSIDRACIAARGKNVTSQLDFTKKNKTAMSLLTIIPVTCTLQQNNKIHANLTVTET